MFNDPPEAEDIGTVARKLPPYYVAERVKIAISPSGRCPIARNCYPLPASFTERETISNRKQLEASLEVSASPKAVIKGTTGKGRSTDRIPATIYVKPIFIGSEGRRSFIWDYRLTSVSESHLELSSTHPPSHAATYPLVRDHGLPDNFRIKLDVTYGKKSIVPWAQYPRPGWPGRMKLSDIGWKHMAMTLEATINRDDVDGFQFPTREKKGCPPLAMEIKFNEGNIARQCAPQESKLGSAVTSRLNNKVTSM